METLLAGLKIAGKWALRLLFSRVGSGRSRKGKWLVAAIVALLLFVLSPLFLVLVMLSAIGDSGEAGANCSKIPGEEKATKAYVQVYNKAADAYGINCFLLASIHKQESDFSRSSLRGVSEGINDCGAAGPAQMGVVGIAPYDPNGTAGEPGCNAGATWRSHWEAFAKIEPARFLAGGVRLSREKLASCGRVPPHVGCVYDDFDALAGAAHKLKADGATADLYSDGTRSAVCSYIGSCSNVDTCGGRNSYCDVLPRAQAWEKEAAAARPGVSPVPVVPGRSAWPLPDEFTSVVSGFKLRWGKMHTGLDIPAPGPSVDDRGQQRPGTPIVAWRTGRVVSAGWNGGYGNFTCIQHPDSGVESCYAHQSRIVVRPGQFVIGGTKIGEVGNTGHSFGSHLHFEIRTADGVKLCPAPFLGLDPKGRDGAGGPMCDRERFSG